MQILLENSGKKYNRQWVFRNLNFIFPENKHIAVLGKNGSGKSTLLKILAGYTSLSEGNIKYFSGGKDLIKDIIYSYTNIVSPHLQLIEEFTLKEFINFHFKFRRPLIEVNNNEIMELLGLQENADKPIRFFSSGMKQKLKLGIAVFSKSKLLLLDEPCTNLDKEARIWYQQILSTYSAERTVIVFSNHNDSETHSCTESFTL